MAKFAKTLLEAKMLALEIWENARIQRTYHKEQETEEEYISKINTLASDLGLIKE